MLRLQLVDISILSCGALSASCGRGPQASGSHPDSRFIDNSIPISFEVPLEARAQDAGLAIDTVPLAASRDTGLIGELYAATILRSGAVVIVDDKLQVVRIFDAQGSQRQVIGRGGQGPGEFLQPLAAIEGRRGVLYVSDANRRIQSFVRDSSGFRYQGSFVLPLGGDDLCFLGDTLVVQGATIDRAEALHLVDRQGNVLASFGTVYRSPNPDANEALTVGQCECLASSNRVVFAPRSGIAEARAYSREGRPVWRTRFANAKINVIEDRPEAGLKVTLSKGGVHSLFSMVQIPEAGLLVQWNYRTYEQVRRSESLGMILSFLLDPTTGRPIPLGRNLPPILAASDSVLLIASADPYPAFELRRYSVRGSSQRVY